ncbi:MAG: DUF2937 family protein [Paracoccaceae bacterium]|jgi:hypothetical protein|nr:DUF2937 family protein [Paracoccaceae bacterium]
MRSTLAFLGGLAGAVTLSQGPEFSQQYLQRLGGQAEALGRVVAEFDASAAKAGVSRDQALAELSGSTFLQTHQGDMRALIARADRVQADYTLLRATGPLERLALPHRFRDRETLDATWADFRPAVPVTPTGFIAAGIGFAGAWVLSSLLLGMFLRPFRRRAA